MHQYRILGILGKVKKGRYKTYSLEVKLGFPGGAFVRDIESDDKRLLLNLRKGNMWTEY